MKKYILSESQFRGLLKNLNEDDADFLADDNINYDTVSTIDDLKNFVEKKGEEYKEKSKTKQASKYISDVLKSINDIDDKEVFERYFTKILSLISKYKRGSFSIKKLAEIVKELSKKDINLAKEELELIIKIFEDERFTSKHGEKLLRYITGRGQVDLDKFYDQTKKAYLEYEESFVTGNVSPFTLYRTSPRLSVRLDGGVKFQKINIRPDVFNRLTSDVARVSYLIDEISKYDRPENPYDLITYVIRSLKFRIDFQFDDTNVKSDLVTNQPLLVVTNKGKKSLVDQGKYVEIKSKSYKTPDFLSEFFKYDATDANYNKLVGEMSKVSSENAADLLKHFTSVLVNKLKSTLNQTNGGDIINHLTNNMGGIIFADEVFVPKKFLEFYWNDIGFARKPRLSIFYNLKNGYKAYKINRVNNEFTNILTPLV